MLYLQLLQVLFGLGSPSVGFVGLSWIKNEVKPGFERFGAGMNWTIGVWTRDRCLLILPSHLFFLA